MRTNSILKFNPLKSLKRSLQRSIQAKLAFVLLLVGFISLSLLGAVSVWLSRQEVQTEVGKRNREVAVLVAGQVDAYLGSIVSDLKFASNYFSTSVTDRDPTSLIVFRLLKKNADLTYQTLAYIDRNGVRRAFYAGSLDQMQKPGSSVLDQSSVNMANDPAYLTTKAGKVYYSHIYFTPDANPKEPLLIVAVPVQDSNDTFLGSLIVEVNLKHMLEIVQTVKSDRTTEATLLDETGMSFASSNPKMLGVSLPSHQVSLMRVSDRESGEFTNDQGQLYFSGYALVSSRAGWGVIVSQEADEALAGVNQLAFVALAVMIIAIIGIGIIAILVSKNITRPIRELATAANRITTTGELNEQIPITSQDEVGELTASFNGMILGLRKTRQALEHWNRQLEHKVEVRTQELTSSNEKLEHINDELERVNLHKSQFLANMSHELRTPLNAIIGFSEVLQDQLFGELNDKQLRYINNVLSSGRHLLNLVNDILDLSKVEAGRMELHWEEFSSRQSVSEVLSQLSTLAAQKELNLRASLTPGLDMITADRGRFRQILYNLLSNAIKFTPQGGTVEVKGWVEPGPEAGSRQACFEVVDTGIGINPEHLETIFESFRQVDNTYSRQYQGTGLGLALTRKLVEMHGGLITVQSQPGIGSTFSFTLPLIGAAIIPVFEDNPLLKAPITSG